MVPSTFWTYLFPSLPVACDARVEIREGFTLKNNLRQHFPGVPGVRGSVRKKEFVKRFFFSWVFW